MTARRFVDVLNWGALVAPGVMACKDGSLLAGWEVTGIDSESMEPEALAGELRHVGFALSSLSRRRDGLVRVRAAPVGAGRGAGARRP